MSKIKFTIDTQDADGIAKAVRMLQAINGTATTVATTETETEEVAEEETTAKKERKPRQSKVEKAETKVETETETKVETETEEKTAEEVEEKPTEKESPKETKSVTLDELRTLLSEKVGDHRESIKNKLKELGAASVSTLAEDKYEELFNFLDTL